MSPESTILLPLPGITLKYELQLGGGLSKALVADVNGICDCAEDAGAGSVLQLALADNGERGEAVPNVTLVNTWERALRRIERLPLPTVATLDGRCGSLGMALLLTADYRIAAPDLRLGLALDGETSLPGMVLHRLANQIGLSRARRMALFMSELDAAAAAEYGLVDEIAADTGAAARAFVQGLKPAALRDLAIRRRLILEAPSSSYEEGLGNYLAACDRVLRSAAIRPVSTGTALQTA